MGALTLLVTGAGGFVGRHVVADAQARGHHVIAVTRRDIDLSATGAADALRPLVARSDAVIHCAASMSGAHDNDTIKATQSLLSAMQGQSARLVLVSSIAVYDPTMLRPGSTVDETSQVEETATARDSYTCAKRQQETLASAARPDLWILRPGAVYGPGRLWNAHIGHGIGPVLLRMERGGQLPICHIIRCAEALVSAAERPPQGAQILNIVDDDLPDRDRFIAALRPSGWPRVVLPLNWRLLMPLAKLIRLLRLPAPGVLRPAVLKGRMMPLNYSGQMARHTLDLRPTGPFQALIPKGRT